MRMLTKRAKGTAGIITTITAMRKRKSWKRVTAAVITAKGTADIIMRKAITAPMHRPAKKAMSMIILTAIITTMNTGTCRTAWTSLTAPT